MNWFPGKSVFFCLIFLSLCSSSSSACVDPLLDVGVFQVFSRPSVSSNLNISQYFGYRPAVVSVVSATNFIISNSVTQVYFNHGSLPLFAFCVVCNLSADLLVMAMVSSPYVSTDNTQDSNNFVLRFIGNS